MKLTVLVDNNTLIDQYFYGEPAVSYYIEDEGVKVLFDIGYSDLFLRNSIALKKDLTKVDYVVLSHGHNDHTGGLSSFVKYFKNIERSKFTAIIGHSDVFHKKYYDGRVSIGAEVTTKDLLDVDGLELNLSQKPIQISDNLFFLGEIPRCNRFENQSPIGIVLKDGVEEPDYLLDDSALVYKSDRGLFIITGCSHAGICNIIEYAKEVCRNDRICGVIGGFHLLNPDKKQLEQTIDYLSQQEIEAIYPCHCIDLNTKVTLAQHFKVHEVGVSLEINI